MGAAKRLGLRAGDHGQVPPPSVPDHGGPGELHLQWEGLSQHMSEQAKGTARWLAPPRRPPLTPLPGLLRDLE